MSNSLAIEGSHCKIGAGSGAGSGEQGFYDNGLGHKPFGTRTRMHCQYDIIGSHNADQSSGGGNLT